jgi:hypothetical protein
MIRTPKSPSTVATHCAHCAGPLVVTRDAIGRPRYRCPDCQGVNTTVEPAGTVGPTHSQTATSSTLRSWGAPAPQSGPPRRLVVPTRRG